MNRHHVYDLFLMSVLIWVLYETFRLAAPFLGALLLAIACSVVFYPLYQWLRRRMYKKSDSLSSLAAVVLVFVLFVGPTLLVGWGVVRQSEAIAPVAKKWIATLSAWRRGNVTDATPIVGNVKSFSTRMGIRSAEFREQTIQLTERAIDLFSVAAKTVAQNTVVVLVHLLIMLFALFFMFRDGPRFYRNVEELVPLRQPDKEALTARLRDTLNGFARGWVLTSVIQGLVATAGYLIVGTPGAMLLGVLTAAIGVLPVVGTFGVWVPVSFYFFATGAMAKGAFILAWGTLLVVGLIDAVVRPYLMGKTAALPIFPLFFALMGGVEVWGAKGILLGPLFVAALPHLVSIYRARFLRRAMDPVKGKRESDLESSLVERPAVVPLRRP